MAHKHGVARGTNDHTEHGDPQVGHADGRSCTITDAQHVAHGFEERIRVLLTPGHVLQGHRERERHREKRERDWQELLQGSEERQASL